MSPIVLVGTVRAPCYAHILHALLARTNGAPTAFAVVAEVLEAARRGTLCCVTIACGAGGDAVVVQRRS